MFDHALPPCLQILAEGQAATDTFAAAVKLRELLRDRAALLIVDRTDLAVAAEADGVMLTAQGLCGTFRMHTLI